MTFPGTSGTDKQDVIHENLYAVSCEASAYDQVIKIEFLGIFEDRVIAPP